jgi:hypothetical protein
MTEAKYLVQGFCSDTDGGFDDEAPADTIKEARERAQYMMSDTYTRIVESTVPVVYVRVINAKTGENVLDFGQPLY